MAAQLAGSGKKNKFDLGQNSDINVTPFVDVMLVLLIIFMVTAPLATVSIKIDIPPAQAPKNPTKPPTIISIAQNGDLAVSFATSPTTTQNRPATLQDMNSLLAASLGGPDPTLQQVFVHADQHVRYGVFMSVVNQLQLDGYYKIGIISEEVTV
ncbi:MAG TPA: biopolymer transporter ExbD [Caulobacteraceae bacterium]|nr:biopolymer transporter ExbD [Caulobacteraceae bacterium]